MWKIWKLIIYYYTRGIDRFIAVADALPLASPSPMQQFYQNKSIFLTGGTGFLGKVIMEKLLRTCQIDTMYVLIRAKKGKDISTRIEDMVNDVVSIKFRHFA